MISATLPLTSPDHLCSFAEVGVFSAGLAIVLVVGLDLISATLSGGGRFGLYSGPACRATWRLLRRSAQAVPPIKDPLLNSAGPLMLVLVLTLWVALPTLGFALMILPGLDGDFVAGGGKPIPVMSRHFLTALYISGFGFTTLGVGPFVPQSNVSRLLLVTQAAAGFATFTLAITYLLSALSALRRRNAFARQVHHLTGGTNDSLRLLEAIGHDAHLRRQVLLELGRGLHDVHESHLAYPVLHYLRHHEPHFSMSSLAGITSDLIALSRAVTPPEDAWHRSADATVADGAARQMLHELSGRFLPNRYQPSGQACDSDEVCDADLRRLDRAAKAIGRDPAAPDRALKRYRNLRRDWSPIVRRFQRDMHSADDQPTIRPSNRRTESGESRNSDCVW